MARGKYLSLEEARKTGQLDRFIKEHPSKADAERFGKLLDAMTSGGSNAKNHRHGKPNKPKRGRGK